MAIHGWLLALLLCMCTLTVKAQEPVYNYYLVFVNGDTVTEGIKWVNLWYNDKQGRNVIRVKFEDGKVRSYNPSGLVAFNYYVHRWSFFRWKSKDYYERHYQTLSFTDKELNTNPMRYYEMIHTCNNHVLYRGFEDNDFEEYFITENGIMKYHLPDRRKRIMDATATLMPDCTAEIEYKLWGYRKDRKQQSKKPEKPEVGP